MFNIINDNTRYKAGSKLCELKDLRQLVNRRQDKISEPLAQRYALPAKGVAGLGCSICMRLHTRNCNILQRLQLQVQS